ncbi:MAG: hypothetical protein K8S54_14305 [Spirochaetia bacterium]|nr:hypothetical protein [Spirochaetia bacterium]
MARPYPALGRLRKHRPAETRSEKKTEKKGAGLWSGILSNFFDRLRAEWSRRSGLFLSGLLLLAGGLVFCISSFFFLISSLYVGLRMLTGSELIALVLMFLVSASGAIFLVLRALSNFSESVEVDRKDGELRIQD